MFILVTNNICWYFWSVALWWLLTLRGHAVLWMQYYWRFLLNFCKRLLSLCCFNVFIFWMFDFNVLYIYGLCSLCVWCSWYRTLHWTVHSWVTTVTSLSTAVTCRLRPLCLEHSVFFSPSSTSSVFSSLEYLYSRSASVSDFDTFRSCRDLFLSLFFSLLYYSHTILVFCIFFILYSGSLDHCNLVLLYMYVYLCAYIFL